ncbi:MAG: hypothetical protein ABFD66_02040 [Smithella sp.]
MDYKKLAEEMANGIEAETMKLIKIDFNNLPPLLKQRYDDTHKAEHEAWVKYLEAKLKEFDYIVRQEIINGIEIW